ncbi:hypothetical protein [Scytonema millei]|uniref:Uncharacterized protein n=1 Tax=Scytonema millei VB511283 TaxID=1245923 RepID=A0A9X5I5E9_9CYAN|nr:hypothetical protein [Scytonema millei]NHC35956.1 hypothetical protein [Scytonema millei VB511283]
MVNEEQKPDGVQLQRASTRFPPHPKMRYQEKRVRFPQSNNANRGWGCKLLLTTTNSYQQLPIGTTHGTSW